jgi:tyrosine-protein kinase Etk/Wzc
MLKDSIQSSPYHPELHFLPRGTHSTDPSELLMSNYFEEVIHSLKPLYDVIIIDTPPILAITDGVLISRYAGTNYIVIGANAHQPHELDIALKRITNANVRINGSIFNFYKRNLQANYHTKYVNNYYYSDNHERV